MGDDSGASRNRVREDHSFAPDADPAPLYAERDWGSGDVAALHRDVLVKLVHNSGNVATFSIDGVSVADALRVMADEIEAGEFGEVRHATVLLDTPSQLYMESRGLPFSRYETAGLLALAARTVFDA